MGSASARWDRPLRFDRFPTGATGVLRRGRNDAIDRIVGERLLFEHEPITAFLDAFFWRRFFWVFGTRNVDFPECGCFARPCEREMGVEHYELVQLSTTVSNHGAVGHPGGRRPRDAANRGAGTRARRGCPDVFGQPDRQYSGRKYRTTSYGQSLCARNGQ